VEQTWDDLLNQLEAAGFYRYTPPGEMAELRAKAKETGWLFGLAGDGTRRSLYNRIKPGRLKTIG
jgi:hypothetical protein